MHVVLLYTVEQYSITVCCCARNHGLLHDVHTDLAFDQAIRAIEIGSMAALACCMKLMPGL